MNKFLQAQLFAIHNENNGDGSDLPGADAGGGQQADKPATSAMGGAAPQQESGAAGGGEGGDGADDKPDYGTLPENEDGYAVELEGFNFDEFKADESNKGFLKAAHAKGLTNEQVSFVISEYNSRAGDLVASAAVMDAESCVTALKAEWGDDTDKNMGLAYRAAKAAGFTDEQINDSSFGNNPAAVKLAAYFGAQLGEDTPPPNTQSTSGEDIQELMASEAYTNSKHPDHKRVYAKVEQHYKRLNP